MDIFLTRQPVFDRYLNVFAYDLMFHTDFENLYQNPDWDSANNTSLALNLLSYKLEAITRGKQAIIRFNDNMLQQDLYKLFPAKNVAVELRHPSDENKDTLAVCKQIRSAGKPVVLDITDIETPADDWLMLSDIVKLNVTASAAAMAINRQNNGNANIKFLAEKVDNKALFDKAMRAGCHYFTGDFYGHPGFKVCEGVPSQKINQLLLLQEINYPDISFDRLTEIIKRDVGLSYKLMQYINSAYFGFAQDIRSLNYALALLGIFSIKKWLSKELLYTMCQDKPDELVVNSLVRARFCELISQKTSLQHRASEMFLIGLFSRLDAFLDRDLSEVLDTLPLSDDIKSTLTAEPSVFNDLFQLMLAYESGDWQDVKRLADAIGFRVSDLPVLFIKSLEWSHHLFCEV